jgi:carboxypeptidase family protein
MGVPMNALAAKAYLRVWSKLSKTSLMLAATFAALLLCLPASAQLNTGRISGQITDQTGGAIAGATVTVIDVARGQNRALTSDAAGDYAAPNLTPGIYTVRAEFMGFQTIERQNVEVTVGGDVRVDLTLQPGATTQTVTVTESIPVVNTTNAQTGGVLENKLLTDLPTIGRNYRWQQSLVPGVMVQMGSASTTFSVDVNGTTDGHATNSLVDGLYEQNYFTGEVTFGGSGEAGFTTILPLDAIQEVNLTTNPKAEYGWVPGVTTSIGLKSGTNDMHGEAYAFGRDTALSAKNAFASGPTPLGFEQFGGNVGGPIKKNKLFYFASYEGFREEATSITGNIIAPTSADLGAASTALTESIPDAMADIINNHGGAAALNQLSLNLAGCNYQTIKSIAAPTTGAALAADCATNQALAPGLWNNASLGQVPDAGHSDNGIIKADYHINDHHALNASFAYGSYEENAAGNSAAKITQNYWEEVLGVTANMARVVEIWTPNSNWLNEARWGRDEGIRPVARAECAPNGDLSNPTGLGASTGGFGGPNYAQQYGLLSGAPGCGIPTITLSSPITGQLGFSNSRIDNEVDEQGADSLSYTHGSHQFKFGTDIRAISVLGAKVLDSQSGTIGFGASGDAAFSGASSLEDFLVGQPSSETIRSGSPVRTTETYLIAAFAEDDWRIKPRLTLNLGLREEIDTAPASNTDNLGNFSPTSQTGIVAVTQPFKNQYTLEPRVGMAWDITGKGTTTLRAGGGVLHALITLMNFVGGGSTTASNYDNAPTGETLYNLNGSTLAAPGDGKSAFTSLIPQAASGVITSNPIIWNSNTALFPTPIPAACGNGFPVNGPGTVVGANNPLNPAQCLMSGGDPNLNYYRYYFWNVNFQHAFTNNLSLDIGYVGSRTTGIIQSINLNQAAPIDTANPSPSAEEQNAPYYNNPANKYNYPWFSNIFYQTGGQNDNFRSLQIYLVERPTHGLSFTGSYTYAGNFETQGVLNVNVPVTGVNGPYGANAYPAHNIAITTTYDIPGIKVPGQMLSGWTLTGHISYLTGVPQTFLDTTNDLTGSGTAGTPWTLYGPAAPFSQIFGRAGTIPCYGVAKGTGVTAGTFAKAPCTSVLAGSAATPWSNLPAACIQAAQNESSFSSGLTQGQTGTGLAQLAAIGCYMVNGSAIVPPAQGTYGNMLPDAIAGPGFSGLDASLSKTWKIKERYSAQFRAEGFNLFNRTIYTGASNNLGNPKAFGLATSTPDNAHGDPIQSRGGARYVQLGLKLFF